MTYELERIGPRFGARVTGLDLREDLDAATGTRLADDLLTHRVLVVPGQTISHDDLVRVSRHFGPVDVYPVARYVVEGHPEILKISNIFEDGEPIGLYDGPSQEEWHTDYSWKPQISRASLLYSAVAPQRGGATVFADTTAAYDDLPEAQKARIDGLKAVHSMTYLVENQLPTNPFKKPLTQEEKERAPDIEQPVVRVHPVTGRRSLLLGSMIISGIVGLTDAAAERLLDELLTHATAQRYLYRHQWAVGDVVIWDNHATMHTRTACEDADHRLLYRTTVL